MLQISGLNEMNHTPLHSFNVSQNIWLQVCLDHSPMPINTDHCQSTLWNWSKCWLILINADQCQLIPINCSHCWSMQINARLCCSIWHWSALIKIDQHWEGFLINTTILIGIGHWSRESCWLQTWLVVLIVRRTSWALTVYNLASLKSGKIALFD